MLLTDKPTEIVIGRQLARWIIGKHRPGYVYAWIRAGVPLYIGSTANPRSRLRTHDVVGIKEAIARLDEIRIWEFPTQRNAFDEEMLLIKKHRPRYNFVEGRDDAVRSAKRTATLRAKKALLASNAEEVPRPIDHRIYSTKGAARLIPCCINSLYRWEEEGAIPPAKRIQRGSVSTRCYTLDDIDLIRDKVADRLSLVATIKAEEARA
jgi:predicted GIY-YIG superfamily endonuclease